MNDQKVVRDWILTTQDTIYALQEWLGRLELWQSSGQVDPADFAEACRLLQEAGLWGWAREAGGHGIERLAAAIEARTSQGAVLTEGCRDEGPMSGLGAYWPGEDVPV